jgi:translation initiation factor IF-2
VAVKSRRRPEQVAETLRQVITEALAREVREGLECGIGIENFNDLKVGDRIESFRMEEVKRTLQPAAESAGSRA